MKSQASEEYAVIGKPIPKKDAWSKVTGEARYADDLIFPGMLFGKLLRSPHPHARILNVDVSAALKLSGVRAVVTGRDFPGIKFGAMPHTRDSLPLAIDRVRYIGEEVAAVAAVDEAVAEEALDLIRVEYEPLPAVFDPEQAMAPEAPQLHEHSPNNVSAQTVFEAGDVASAFASSDYVREDTFETQPAKHGMLEPHVCIALWDSAGKITLWSPKQSPYVIWMQLALALGIEPSRIRVIQTTVGGGFAGGKQEALPMDFCAIMLSKQTGRHIKIVHTMDEVLTIAQLRHPMKIWLKTGLKKDGTLVAQHCRIIADGGAYTSTGQWAAYLPGSIGMNLPYRLPNIKYEAYRIYTNNATSGAVRGFNLSQIFFARESQLEMMAEELGIDPIELRLNNACRPGDVTRNGFRLGTFGFTESLEKVVEASGWRHKRGKLPKYRGIGIGSGGCCTGARVAGHCSSTAEILVRQDATVLLNTGSTDMGQGADTVLSMIAAEVLGVGVDDVRFATVDTDVTPVDPGSYGSRVTFWSGHAVKRAAEDARRQLAEIAADELEANPDDLVFRDRRIYVRHNPQRGIAFGELVQFAESQIQRLIVGRGSYAWGDELVHFPTGQGNISPAYAPSACVAEVEVDPGTGQVSVTGLWIAHDCGFPLNPLLVSGQVLGASVMGIGQAFYENLIRIDGKVMNSSFRDYKMPLSVDVPRLENVEQFDIITREPSGPFGAKEAGEGPGTGVVAALANAVYDATGVRVKTLPISPEKLLFALHQKNAR